MEEEIDIFPAELEQAPPPVAPPVTHVEEVVELPTYKVKGEGCSWYDTDREILGALSPLGKIVDLMCDYNARNGVFTGSFIATIQTSLSVRDFNDAMNNVVVGGKTIKLSRVHNGPTLPPGLEPPPKLYSNADSPIPDVFLKQARPKKEPKPVKKEPIPEEPRKRRQPSPKKKVIDYSDDSYDYSDGRYESSRRRRSSSGRRRDYSDYDDRYDRRYSDRSRDRDRDRDRGSGRDRDRDRERDRSRDSWRDRPPRPRK